MKTSKTFFARAAMLLLALSTTIARAQSTDPIVTGYFPIGGTPGNYDSHTFTMLVDGDRTTKWCITNQPIASKFYIEFYSLEAFVPTGYILTTGDDNATFTNRNPKSWNIMARPSLSDTWTTIATVTNDNVLQDVNTTDFEFTIDNSTVYKYFRFEVTAVVGGGSTPVFQLGEFRFRGHPEVVEPEIVTVDLSTITSNYTVQDGEVLTGTLDTENHPVKISIADGATVTLNDVTINGVNNNSYAWAGITCEGDATIVLESNTTNIVKGFQEDHPGIYVPSGSTLIIKGSGSLNTSSNNVAPGIGGIYHYPTILDCGNIIIEDGTITATGGSNSPAIGSGRRSSCGTIEIRGGNITVEGGFYGAGIGTGWNGTCGNITISGGNISATGGTMAAAIGSGCVGHCGNITITNEVIRVSARKNGNTYSIGKGADSSSSSSTCDTITIGGIEYPNGITDSPYTFTPVRDISLADGTAYTQTYDYYATTATYTKTLGEGRKGNFQAWFVPFDYTITSADTQKFKFYKINMIANSATPSQDASDDIWVFLKPIDAGDMLHANMPYVYKPLEDMESYSFTSNNVMLKAPNTDVLATMETMEDIYEVYGTYANTSPSASDPFYYINFYGGISLGNSSSVVVGPYRWIIRKTSKYGNTASYAPAMRFFDDEDEDPTGIQTTDNRQQTTEGVWHDLNGCRISGKPTQKGIYIYNGKKIAIK